MGPGGGKGEQAGLYVLAAADIFKYVSAGGAYAGLTIWVGNHSYHMTHIYTTL
jgi:hypothetical protein